MNRIMTLAAGCAFLLASAPLARAQTVAPQPSASGVDRTRQILEAYWENHDPAYVAEDAVFTMMPTGEEIRGRDAIAAHLHHFYNEAFNARAERVNAVFGENKGVLEAVVVGRHTGEFGGVPASGREIRVPLGVAYDLEGDKISRARIYLMANVLFQQIAAASGGAPPASP
jgi:steroid delta-isomerase-like uncharacterized protein